MNAKSSLASSFALIFCGVVSRMAASAATCSGVASNLSGNAHSDLTGVDSASASPVRSTMRPRCAGTSSSRECRAEPCPCRNSLSNHCRYSERPSSTMNSSASAPNTTGERNRGSTSGGASPLRSVRPASAVPARSLRLLPSLRAARRRRCATAEGNCMRSWSRAIFSTRAGMPHVDCSSCSCPYSVSSARPAACSRSRATKLRRAWCRDVTSDSAQATRTHQQDDVHARHAAASA